MAKKKTPKALDEEFGERLRAAREAAGLSQRDLVNKLPKHSNGQPLTAQAVSNWERGANEVEPYLWRPIVSALGEHGKGLFSINDTLTLSSDNGGANHKNEGSAMKEVWMEIGALKSKVETLTSEVAILRAEVREMLAKRPRKAG